MAKAKPKPKATPKPKAKTPKPKAKTPKPKAKATAKPAPKPKPKSKTKATAAPKPTARAKPSSTRKLTAKRSPPPLDTLGPDELVARVALHARAEGEPGDELPAVLTRLQEVATAALVPSMLGILEDDDPHGVLWAVFYLIEGFDDDYLAGLIDALAGLRERAPGWADTALLRIINTRGEPEDCTAAFVALAKRRRAPARKAVVTALRELLGGDEPLAPVQEQAIKEMLAAL